jgi:hypothetical protein
MFHPVINAEGPIENRRWWAVLPLLALRVHMWIVSSNTVGANKAWRLDGTISIASGGVRRRLRMNRWSRNTISINIHVFFAVANYIDVLFSVVD